MSNLINAVIFDWAGTTIDYGCVAPVRVFVDVFKKNGIDISLEEARGPMGMAKRDHVVELLKMQRIKKYCENANIEITEDFISHLYSQLEPQMAETAPEFSTPIPGVIDLIGELKSKKIKIGSSTGYTEPIMKNVLPLAWQLGYEPDCVVTSSDVPEGRPKPWMCYQNAIQMDVFPFSQMIKIGDTVADIKEGLNAGMWTIGFTKCGNEVGLTEEGIANTSSDVLEEKISKATDRLIQAGAHYVAEGPWDCLPVILEIEEKIKQNIKP